MKLSDLVFATQQFNVNNNIIVIGFADKGIEGQSDVIQPLLLKQNDADWNVIKEYDIIWLDLQESLTPDYVATSIVTMFNKELEKLQEGGALTWNQKLIAIFQLRLALVDNQFVINP